MSAGLRMTSIVVGAMAAIFLTGALSPGVGDDQPIDKKLEDMNRRIKSLEKAVGLYAAKESTASMIERVATLERRLGELSQDAARAKRSSADGSLRDSHRALETGERQRGELRARLTGLERDLRDVSGSARELRSLRAEQDRQRTAFKDLESRIRRLESRP